MTQIKKKRRKRRRWKKQVLILPLVVLLAILAIFVLPVAYTNHKLRDLGYDKAEISSIKSYKLTDTILKNRYYTPFLAKALRQDTLNVNYLPLYLVMDENTVLTDDDFLLYNRLEDMGYEVDQLQNLFQHLTFREMTPLLVFDYQYNEQPYIEDCLANRESNTEDSFTLSNSYVAFYNKPKAVADINAETVLVNKKNMLTEADVPENLTYIDTTYAIDGIQLTAQAAKDFQQMAYAASQEGNYIYAVLGYRSYTDQDNAYRLISYYNGEAYAEQYAARAGASEHQTGLAVNLSIVGQESEEFASTTSYQWLRENAAQYGFIERYPLGKVSITGFPFEGDHYRYVGKELAKEIQLSHMTYEEYYGLYLAPWHDEAYNPNRDTQASAEPTSTPQPTETAES